MWACPHCHFELVEKSHVISSVIEKSRFMKISELNPYSFRNLIPKIKAQIAEEASHHLIVSPEGDMVQRHLSVGSTFCRAVVSMGYLTQEQMNHAALRYRLGMSRDGGVIFWQIGHFNNLYDGKIMYYRPDCHRDHNHLPTWVMSELKAFYLSDAPNIAAELQSTHCLFGMHLLDECHPEPVEGSLHYGRDDRGIAVVEAEKTAVIMSEIYPDYLWMAAGGMNELTAPKLFPLRGRKIVLMPDTDEHHQAYSNWFKICKQAQCLLGHPIYLSPLLEQKASPDQKRRKIDILDYYLETLRLSSPNLYTSAP